MADKAIEKKADSKNDGRKEKKPNVFKRLAKYFRECRSEVGKIVWPTPQATFKNLGIVLVIIAVVGLFIFGLDNGLYALLGLIMEVNVG